MINFCKPFELYATGRYSLRGLCEEMWRRGLRAHRTGQKFNHQFMTVMVKNRFYTGAIRVKKTGETFAGAHVPLIERAQTAHLLYKSATAEEKREPLKIVTSNREAYPENVAMALSEPFLTIATRRCEAGAATQRPDLPGGRSGPLENAEARGAA